jgi:hypothetical protein
MALTPSHRVELSTGNISVGVTLSRFPDAVGNDAG